MNAHADLRDPNEAVSPGLQGRRSMLVSAVCMAMLAAGPSSGSPPPSLPLNVLNSDVVFEGRVLSARPVTRAMLGGCPPRIDAKKKLIDFQIRPLRTVQGIVNAEVLPVTELVISGHEMAGVSPGARVLVYGRYKCVDGGRLWGAVAVADTARGEYAIEILYGAGDGESRRELVRVSHEVLNDSVSTGLDSTQLASTLGVVALGAFVVQEKGIEGDDTALLRVASARILAGSFSSSVQEIVGPRRRDCIGGIRLGDTLVVPLRAADRGRTRLLLPFCLKSLRYEAGFIQYFGLALEELVARFQPSPHSTQFILPRPQESAQ